MKRIEKLCCTHLIISFMTDPNNFLMRRDNLRFKLSVPSKTFVAGEYLVLQGGPALILSTEPRFELVAEAADPKNSQEHSKSPFHPMSPAGRFYELSKKDFSGWNLTFKDPWNGLGGFGGSSAEYLLLYALRTLKASLASSAEYFLDIKEMLSIYKTVSGEGFQKPSGADLVGMVKGGLTWFDREKGVIKKFPWLFENLTFHVVHTQKKLKTHDHLNHLKLQDLGSLRDVMTQLFQALESRNTNLFVNSINNYGAELAKKNWQTEHSKFLISSVKSLSGVVAAKSCGAMGSDVLFIVTQKTSSKIIQDWALQNNCLYVGDNHSGEPDFMSSGIVITDLQPQAKGN